jgi:hypothetical protein
MFFLFLVAILLFWFDMIQMQRLVVITFWYTCIFSLIFERVCISTIVIYSSLAHILCTSSMNKIWHSSLPVTIAAPSGKTRAQSIPPL